MTKKYKADSRCYAGGKFGRDFATFSECADCRDFDLCADEKVRLDRAVDLVEQDTVALKTKAAKDIAQRIKKTEENLKPSIRLGKESNKLIKEMERDITRLKEAIEESNKRIEDAKKPLKKAEKAIEDLKARVKALKTGLMGTEPFNPRLQFPQKEHVAECVETAVLRTEASGKEGSAQ